MSYNVDQAMKRPADYAKLSGEDQWATDRRLGILDWDPTKDECEEYDRRYAERYTVKQWYDKPCCFTCAHWEEEVRAKMAATIAEWTKEEYDLSQLDGVAEYGDCVIKAMI